ncbi:Na+/H+ antiporter NhaC [Aestuariirhabdus sp. Z084]|uniref:Na+/H+ antiporter NhaC n=1 Tax=Aestuariirhabdus haliotis TaxID=2918751 RepID=UPI00201B3A74|nr:Na+/H+ antiporter NhaC [Aestuariirhabdus haliotis]MCL6416533.1 Na+/H+ antiporter NhaC [Aestuariirhabdus haliotis]MCL6420523.1 Na+/H+ antiporter NhaC [Aestuariirhabdus haliotis]
METTENTPRPNLIVSLFPLLFLIVMMVINVVIYKDDSTFGPNQYALLLSSIFAACIGIFALKLPYKTLEDAMINSISMALQATLILLIVGSLISIWMMSGIVPLMIYYGLQLINPNVFLFVACLISAIVALCTGSSWSTSGTIGIALIAIGHTLGVPVGMVAGAVISGAYFGDKMSPLSDTTNLAPAMAGTDIFTHIRHMVYTSGPAMAMALIGFLILGYFYQGNMASNEDIQAVLTTIEKHFNISPWLLLVPALVIVMVARRMPALPALTIGLLLGIAAIPLFQQPLLSTMTDTGIAGIYKVVLTTAAAGFTIETGNTTIDELFSRGGMASMLNTIWLIICAMIFGGMLEACGMLQRLAEAILKVVRGTGSLIGATIASCIFTNMTASDQYIAIVLPARMFRGAFKRYGLAPKNLSRAVEDAGTVTSVLVPWNSGGAFHAGVLGVSTLAYLPFCFFNILSPLVSIFLGAMNLTMDRIEEEHTAALAAKPETVG